MKRIFLAVAILSVMIYGCGNGGGGGASASSSEPKPVLHEIEEDGYGYLADESGTILYSLEAPYITADFDRKVFVVNPHVYYSPGASYYGAFYDGFSIICAGHPRSGVEELKVDFGPEGGGLAVPKSPYENCSFQAFVVDGKENVFKTDLTIIHFSRKE